MLWRILGRVRCGQAPETCPRCGEKPVAKLIYGFPVMTPELQEEVKAGKIAFGGCCITGYDPRWQCTHCGLRF